MSYRERREAFMARKTAERTQAAALPAPQGVVLDQPTPAPRPSFWRLFLLGLFDSSPREDLAYMAHAERMRANGLWPTQR